ncbi:MAG: hypothetical protein WC538_06285 [Thermoanaerobaculia bacterium]
MRTPRNMMSVMAIVFVCVVAFGALAQQTPAPATEQTVTSAAQPVTPAPTPEQKEASLLNEKKLSDIAVDFKAIARMAEFCDDLAPCAPVIRKVVEQNLDTLREPRTDGTYRWASFARIEANHTSLEKEILKVSTESTLDTIELTAKHVFRVVVSAPKKRNIVSSNNKIFVKGVVAEMTGGDGKVRTSEIPVGVWIAPGDSHSVPLDEIAASARVKVSIGVESGTKKAVASVALLEASLVDDAQNPYYPAVKRLNVINTIVKEKTVSRGQLKAVTEEAVLELPGEMQRMMELRDVNIKRMKQAAEAGQLTGMVAVGDATPDVVHDLASAAKLLSGTVAEQEEGRKALESLIQKLSPPPPPAALSEAAPKTN